MTANIDLLVKIGYDLAHFYLYLSKPESCLTVKTADLIFDGF